MKTISLFITGAVLLLWWGTALAGGHANPLPDFIVPDSLQITALVFHNYQSWAYFVLNQVVNRKHSKLRYWEVTAAQHFDTFISSLWVLGTPVGVVKFVPLHYYLTQGLDMMYAHLKHGNPLPPSQVIRAIPPGLDPYTADNIETLLPLPKMHPGSDRITFSRRVLHIPK